MPYVIVNLINLNSNNMKFSSDLLLTAVDNGTATFSKHQVSFPYEQDVYVYDIYNIILGVNDFVHDLFQKYDLELIDFHVAYMNLFKYLQIIKKCHDAN